MNLIGYARPFCPSSFTIPIYKSGGKHFVHRLNNRLKIEDFTEFDFEEEDIIILKSQYNFEIFDFGPIIYISSNGLPIIEPANKIYEKAYQVEGQNIALRPGLNSEFKEIKDLTLEQLNTQKIESVDVIFNNISSNLDLGLAKFIDIFSDSVRTVFFLTNTVKNIKKRRLNNISVITIPSLSNSSFINAQIMECYIENNMSLPSSFIFANKKAVNKNEERFIEFYRQHFVNQSPIVAARIVPHSEIDSITQIPKRINPLNLSELPNKKSALLKLESDSRILGYSISVQPVAERFNREELKNVWTVLGELGEIDEKISKIVLNRKIRTERSDYSVSFINYEPKDK